MQRDTSYLKTKRKEKVKVEGNMWHNGGVAHVFNHSSGVRGKWMPVSSRPQGFIVRPCVKEEGGRKEVGREEETGRKKSHSSSICL